MASTEEMNTALKHITVLEEAHNILKRTTTEQNPESPNLGGKSVEMISNSIAEMRTYGEGFVIVDQSPSAVDISAIKNTNTKVILRLPDELDRNLVGKSVGLNDEQIAEIARLPKGVAVVYQNDWVESVLCKVDKFRGKESRYSYNPIQKVDTETGKLKEQVLKMILKNRVNTPEKINLKKLTKSIANSKILPRNKITIQKVLKGYKKNASIHDQANMIWDLLDVEKESVNLRKARSVDELDKLIIEVIRKQIPQLQPEYILATVQLIMKKSSLEIFNEIDIYNAWVTALKKKGEVIYG